MRALSRRTTTLIATTALVLPVLASGGPVAAQPNAHRRSLADAVTLAGVKRHLQVYQQIAKISDGTRAASTRGHQLSATYVTALLRAAGYRVTTQEFLFPFSEDRRESLHESTPSARDLPVDVMAFSPATAAGGLTAQLAVVAEDATPGCEATDFPAGTFGGRIALIKRGGCTFAIKARNAANAGAVGALVYNNDELSPDDVFSGTLGTAADGVIPTAGTSLTTGRTLIADAAVNAVTVTIDLEELREQRTSRNVIAETRGGRADNVVMAGGHLDSVVDGPGINDNGSGTAALLEIALQLRRLGINPVNRVRFAFWSAEEFGLVGSEYYVAQLTAAQREDLALYLNFDMIASPNFIYSIYDGDNSDGVGAGPGPAGSGAIEKAFEAFYAGRGLPFEGSDFTGRSDYGPFIAAGIPAGGLFTGAEVRKTPAQALRYGGTAGVAFDHCYHQSCDTIANINDTALNTNADAIATVLSRYAMDTSDVVGPAATARAAAVPEAPHTHDAAA